MSCLFDSLGYFLKLNGSFVRQEICNYLESNNPIIKDLDTKLILDLEDSSYIQKMRRQNVWGGSNEILAACNIWKIKVNVFINNEKTKKIEMLPIDGNYIKIVNLIWKGNHYDPVLIN